MTQVILDAALASQIHAARASGQPVELCDPAGRVLGRLPPIIDLSQWEPVTPDITAEELRRRAQSPERRYTTQEVLAHLEQLCCSGSNGYSRPRTS